MAALDVFKTNKKATGGCAVAGIYETSRNLPGSRRTPRINSHTTAGNGDANEILDAGVRLCHKTCASFRKD
jgi:hypothetical protein